MSITPQAVLAALAHVEEPDLKKDLVTLNMVRDVEVQGQQVRFTVVLTTPACPLKEVIRKACITAVHTLVDPGAQVEVNMTAEVSRPTQANAALPGVRNLVGVVAGKGGVGKSSVAFNLALALARQGARVGLADADVYGPSLPSLVGPQVPRPGVAERDGRTWMLPTRHEGLLLNSLGWMVPPGQPIIWRGPMASNALRQLLTDTDWGELDYLIVDFPPGTGDVHLTLASQFKLAGAVVVTTPQELAVADVRKALGMLFNPQLFVPVLGIVENMAWFETPELPGRRFHVFGQGGARQLAQEYNLPLLAQLPLLDPEHHPAPWALGALKDEYAQLAQAVAQQLSRHNAGVAEPTEASPAEAT